MAVIPDAADIDRQQVRPTETIAAPDTSSAGVGSKSLANLFSSASSTLLKVDQAKKEEAFADANIKYNVEKERLRREAEQDTEPYETMQDRYAEKLSKSKESVVEGISDPRVRARFEEHHKLSDEKFTSAVSGIAFKKEGDFKRAKLSDSLNSLTTLVSESDLTSTEENAFEAHSLIDATRDQGHLTQEQAATMKREWGSRTALANIAAFEDPRNQKEALSSDWAKKNIPEGQRTAALNKAKDEIKSLDADDYVQKAVRNSKNLSEAIKQIDKYPDADMRRSMRQNLRQSWSDTRMADTEARNDRFQVLAKDIDSGDMSYSSMSAEDRALLNIEQLKYLQELEKAPVKTSDPAALQYARDLANSNDPEKWNKLQAFTQNNRLLTRAHREEFGKAAAQGRAPASATDPQLINRIFRNASKEKVDAITTELVFFRNRYQENNDGAQPNEAELMDAITKLGSDYTPDRWGPDLFFTDEVWRFEHEETAKIMNDLYLKDIGDQYPDELEELNQYYLDQGRDDAKYWDYQTDLEKLLEINELKMDDQEIYDASWQLLEENGYRKTYDNFFKAKKYAEQLRATKARQ